MIPGAALPHRAAPTAQLVKGWSHDDGNTR